MSPVGPLLALLLIGHAAALSAGATQLSSSTASSDSRAAGRTAGSTCAWHAAAPCHKQQCPARVWYTTLDTTCPAAPVQAGLTSASTTHQQPANSSSNHQLDMNQTGADSDAGSSRTGKGGQVYIVRFSQYRMLQELKELIIEVSSRLACRTADLVRGLGWHTNSGSTSAAGTMLW